MERELKTRFDTNKRIREKYERLMRRTKYFVVRRDGDVWPYMYKSEANEAIAQNEGIIVPFVDFNDLPTGINSYRVEALNEETGGWYGLTSVMWTAKTLSYWWGTDGKGDLYSWEWRKKKLRFFINGVETKYVYENRMCTFDFPVVENKETGLEKPV